MSVKRYTHEEYLASRRLGVPVMYDTSEGKTYLNVMKHYCRQKPYINAEFNDIMLSKIKSMNKAFAKSN